MKIKDGIIVSRVDGNYVAVDAGIDGQRFNGMLKLNSTAAFVVEALKEETTLEELQAKMIKEYGIDDKTAAESVESVLGSLRSVNLIKE
ncbi:MAG: PqqD family protein [Clostridia bacterium]|nr:PqqD family protein [Clostridia bacterium]